MKVRRMVLMLAFALSLLVLGGVIAPEQINGLPDPGIDGSIALVVEALSLAQS